MSKIGFIGVGKMGEAILKGLISSGLDRSEILIFDIDSKKLQNLDQNLGVTISSIDNIAMSDTILIAVKPQQISDLLNSIKGRVSNKSLLISIAAGVKTKTLENALGDIPVVRVMPNTPALVNSGVSVLSRGTYANENHLMTARKIFDSVGISLEVDEKDQDIVTAISGSGPAYFFLFVEYLIKAAIELGLDKKTARNLVAGTFFGAAKLLVESKESAESLRRNVTSPGGTTEAAIKTLETNELNRVVHDAVVSAKTRSEELSGN